MLKKSSFIIYPGLRTVPKMGLESSTLVFRSHLSYLSLRQYLSKTVHSTHKPKHLSSYLSLGVSSLFLFKQFPHITFGATKDQDEGRHSSTHPADKCQPGHSVYAAASCMGMVGQGGQSQSGKYKSLHIQCQVLYRKLQMDN